MNAKPFVRAYYWKENQLIGNFGDTLVPILLDALGCTYRSTHDPADQAQNSTHTLLMIGSLLTKEDLSAICLPVDVWGCGWKGVCPPAALLSQVRIHAVRGPHTVAGLGLPDDTPLGDPALLLPQLAPRPHASHGRTLVMPHLLRTRLMTAPARCRLTGCDELLQTQVFQRQGLGQPGWQRQFLSLGYGWLRFGIHPYTTWPTIARLAGAGFILTGSLHGAILAQAYGIPWAAYDDGYINAPAKWLDWAAYLGVQLEFVTTLAEGERWWQSEGRRGVVRDLAPLLNAFPYRCPKSLAPTEQLNIVS
ncbi:MAG: polysaccharide pyruvyl transferase family protein [Caldilineaceae bacterium]|nr:polysaccharide pyruvyl transferase family protein [Caldilineaceae bacterium]